MSGQVLEALTEEECYLYAILSDMSGIDIAEFTWHSADHEDECFRCWAFQWAWYRDESPLQIDSAARSVGKSLGIKVRAFSFPFLFPNQEMLITAPELVHLEPITQLIEQQVYTTRLSREMLPATRSAVTHRPFLMQFVNGSRIVGRIPQRDGRGVKGTHPIRLEMDEAQDFPHLGWVELTETLKRGHQGAQWRAHGVTRGLRDDFYQRTQEGPDNPWRIHHVTAMMRPTWTAEEREEKIKQYGSREDPDYRRNILGIPGDSSNVIFVLSKLMENVDSNELSDYNADEYFKVSMKSEMLESMGKNILDMLDFPMRHLSYLGKNKEKSKAKFWAGMDIGMTIDPSEILVFVEYMPKKADETVLKLLTRIQMIRMGYHQQVEAILRVIEFYQPAAFSMDKGGLGLPMFRDIQERSQVEPHLRSVLDIIKGYNFSEKVTVEFDTSIKVSEFADQEEVAKKTGIRRNVKEASTDVLRELVDNRRIELPWDTELLRQFQGGTWTNVRGHHDQYGRKRFNASDDHTLDAARFAAMGWAQYSIEQVMKTRELEPVFDSFVMM